MGWRDVVRRLTGRAAVADGSTMNAAATQFAGRTGQADSLDLVIGLDFGTSSTKVVVRSPSLGRGRALVVKWPEEHGTDGRRSSRDRRRWFLPTALRFVDGECRFVADWRAAGGDDLKFRLVDDPCDLEARARAAAYLGLALRAAREYVLETQGSVYGSYRLRWALHLGMPSGGYGDHEMREAFLAVARGAWALSLSARGSTLEAARQAVQGHGAAGGGEFDEDAPVIEVVPEIVALVGYAQSRRRREGLHVIVDTGASTMDICGFGLLRGLDGDDEFVLNVALVERLGVGELHRRRIEVVEDAGETVREPRFLGAFDAVRDCGNAYVDERSSPLRTKLDAVDERYVQDCASSLMRVIMTLRRKKDPSAPHFRTGLPLFLAGGGAKCQRVQEVVREASERMVNTLVDVGPMQMEPLPTLEALEGRDEVGDMAERFGVAYGLSFDRLDMGAFTPPDEVPDVPNPGARPPVELITKDQV